MHLSHTFALALHGWANFQVALPGGSNLGPIYIFQRGLWYSDWLGGWLAGCLPAWLEREREGEREKEKG